VRVGVAAAFVDDEVIPGDVEVGDGLIVDVGVKGEAGLGLAVPGFVDVHTHGFGGVDFATCDAEDLDRAALALTRTGVTSFRPALLSLPEEETIAALKVIGAVGDGGARMLGAHLEGPFLSGAHPGAHQPSCLRAPDQALLQRLVDSGPVRHMTIAPELPGAIEMISALAASGVTVSLGHSDATADVANLAFDAGATALTHVFNGSRPFRHRDPGIIGVALTRTDVFVEAILDGVHLADETILLVLRAAPGRMVAVTDAMAAAGLGDGVYRLGNQEVTVRGGEARLADGTIASSVLTMDGAFRKLLDLGAGISGAVGATSAAPAALIGRHELGTLRPGTPADVTVLDDEFYPTATWVGGEIRFRR
jgi:N-acetylglucosamine-6-phosphate deacetylase